MNRQSTLRETLLLATLCVVALTAYVTGEDTEIMPAGGHSWAGEKHITAGGTVDINTGGQGVVIKLDAAGITWTGSGLRGMTLNTESLVQGYSGLYYISWHIAFDGTQGKTYLFGVMSDTNADPSDGSPVDQTGCHNDVGVQANTHASVSGCCIATLTAGEYLYMTVEEEGVGAGTDFDIDHGGLTVFQY